MIVTGPTVGGYTTVVTRDLPRYHPPPTVSVCLWWYAFSLDGRAVDTRTRVSRRVPDRCSLSSTETEGRTRTFGCTSRHGT